MRPYETRSRLGLDRSRLRYLIDILLTFGSHLIYLAETFSIFGLVSFTKSKHFFLESRLVSVSEGLIPSRISPF